MEKLSGGKKQTKNEAQKTNVENFRKIRNSQKKKGIVSLQSGMVREGRKISGKAMKKRGGRWRWKNCKKIENEGRRKSR